MSKTAQRAPIIDPVSRSTEILFGLIMVLTFTASLNAAEAMESQVRLTIIAALGCNLAWGLIDAAMYLISAQAGNATSRHTLQAVQTAGSVEEARQVIAGALPPVVADTLTGEELDRIRQRLLSHSAAPESFRLTGRDYLAAACIFLLVFLATLPVVLPFLFLQDVRSALIASHAIAIGSMFLAGWSLGRQWNRPWHVGLAMVMVGLLMVGIALALGG